MSKITIDLVKLIEQAASQVSESAAPTLLQQWLDRNIGAEQFVTVDLAAVSVENETAANGPASPDLKVRISDVITFGDNFASRIHVLILRGCADDLAIDAHYEYCLQYRNIQANTNEPNLKNLESYYGRHYKKRTLC